MYRFMVLVATSDRCFEKPVIREYQRPHHITRFLRETNGPVKYSIQVHLNDSPVITVSGDQWMREKLRDQFDPRKNLSWQEYFQRLMRSQAWYERNKDAYGQIRSVKEGTDAIT